MVPAVIKEGENPTAKSSNTVEPRNSRGTEKDGPSGDSQSSVMEDATPEADKKPSEVSLFSTANFYTNLQDRLRSLQRKRSPPRRSLPRRRRRTSRVPCSDKFTRRLNNICTEEIKVIVWSHIRKKTLLHNVEYRDANASIPPLSLSISFVYCYVTGCCTVPDTAR